MQTCSIVASMCCFKSWKDIVCIEYLWICNNHRQDIVTKLLLGWKLILWSSYFLLIDDDLGLTSWDIILTVSDHYICDDDYDDVSGPTDWLTDDHGRQKQQRVLCEPDLIEQLTCFATYIIFPSRDDIALPKTYTFANAIYYISGLQ